MYICAQFLFTSTLNFLGESMKKYALLSIILVVLASLTFTGFQCGSAESTSAKLYMQRREFDKAEAALVKDLEKNSNSAESWYFLGSVRREMANFEGMMGAFNSSLKISNEFESKINEEKKFVWGNSLNAGVSRYNLSTKASPDSSKIYLEQSIRAYKTAILVNPDSAVNYQNIAIAYHAVGNIDEEIVALKQSLERKKDAQYTAYLISAYVTKAVDAKKANDKAETDANFNKAISTLSDARSADPENQELLSRLIDVYIEAGRASEATPFIKEAVTKNPINKVYQNNLGLLLMQSNDFAGAVEHFAASVAIDSSYLDGLRNGSIAFMKLGQQMKDEAAAKADPKKGITDKSYQEKFKQAALLLKKYVSIKDSDPDIFEALATSYGGAGMVKEAQAALKKADDLRKK